MSVNTRYHFEANTDNASAFEDALPESMPSIHTQKHFYSA